jgi:hypothetical protein
MVRSSLSSMLLPLSPAILNDHLDAAADGDDPSDAALVKCVQDLHSAAAAHTVRTTHARSNNDNNNNNNNNKHRRARALALTVAHKWPWTAVCGMCGHEQSAEEAAVDIRPILHPQS